MCSAENAPVSAIISEGDTALENTAALVRGHYVYILACADSTLYTGYAAEPYERAAAHNAKKGAKYTRSRLPVSLVYFEAMPDRSAALRRENELKRLTREEKLRLISESGGPRPLDSL